MTNKFEYTVEVEVKENPSKSDELTCIDFIVEAECEWEAKMKASDLCAEQFGHNPWSTEIIDWEIL